MPKVDILAIAAHRDDVELTCGGTLIKAAALGRTTAVIDLTQGELGTRGSAQLRGEEAGKAQEGAQRWLEAVLAGPGPSFERALKQAPRSARGEFTAMLDALAETLGDAARTTVGQPARRPVPPALLRHRQPGPFLRAMEQVADAREAAWGNVNQQILLAVLGEELAEVL
jgi:LmbE family N-acetylglucosaminyl deacetylase